MVESVVECKTHDWQVVDTVKTESGEEEILLACRVCGETKKSRPKPRQEEGAKDTRQLLME